jgi:hypothetical protein
MVRALKEGFPMQRNGSSLSSRLAAYATAAKAVGAPKNWPIYAAAAGSALALSTSASASIIYSGPQNLSLHVAEPGGSYYALHASQPMSIDGHHFSVMLRNWFTSSGIRTAAVQMSATTGANLLTNGSGWVRRLGNGAEISSAAGSWRTVFAGRGLVEQADSGGLGPGGSFPAGHAANAASGEGIAGFRVNAGNTSQPQWDYGWIRIAIDDTNSNGWLDTVTIMDWAYNDVADQPMRAGQIPEPGTLSLSLLALGSAGVLAWRRRRKALKY